MNSRKKQNQNKYFPDYISYLDLKKKKLSWWQFHTKTHKKSYEITKTNKTVTQWLIF